MHIRSSCSTFRRFEMDTERHVHLLSEIIDRKCSTNSHYEAAISGFVIWGLDCVTE